MFSQTSLLPLSLSPISPTELRFNNSTMSDFVHGDQADVRHPHDVLVLPKMTRWSGTPPAGRRKVPTPETLDEEAIRVREL